MDILGRYQWPLSFVLEENIMCSDCRWDFEGIGELKEHDKKYQLTWYICGMCVKEKEEA